uniref:Zinc finger CCCH-type containing 7A n=1 Tax=Nothobranchius furzeri TaxID=105023 RepID=A0A8C6K5M7_NOTFU
MQVCFFYFTFRSTLPFPGSQEQYEVFIKDLVCNLFGEGNDVFKEGEWTKSIEMYTEALSIADYADSEDICIPTGLLEKLYANRAAAYLSIGLYDQALEDCEKALQLNEGNHKALYRKAKALKEMGRHQEAYEAVAKCSLAVPRVRMHFCSLSTLKLREEASDYLQSHGNTPLSHHADSPARLDSPYQCFLSLWSLTRCQMNQGAAFLLDWSPFSCLLDYTLHTEDHKCKKDVLLGRMKHSPDKMWKLIRPRPTKTQYVGPYYVCKEVAVGKECLYPGHCTFAYCQEEIDVWTLERKGFISRELLFDPFGPNSNIRLTVPKILQEHRGIFMFLCGVCFDHKPRIISKTNKDDPSLCSHPVTKHNFEDHKCLVHILKENTVRYSKIRPLSPHSQLDLCRHEVRYGCVREDDCFYAHSLIELKVWMMQHELGITHESIVQEAKKYWNATASLQGVQFPIAQRRFGPPNLKMMFVCGQCWRNGQLSEADKNKKYCTAKARHTWAKDRRVVLVSSHERKKWTTVRPLPTKKPIPSQFEICMHVTASKKCQYIGNCTFAHSVEERDLWTYMKEHNIPDMDQLYEQWLLSQKPGWGEEMSSNSVRENGKQIHMPTDYAEEVAGNHCWLCGKNCNSEKQWQQHITSEKHKERVFNSEDDQNCWQYRFPTGTFKVCERFLKGTCTEDDLCKLAHGEHELKEWKERREFLLMKLAKARKDHLIAPNDNDFGKYSFLLKDIK